MTNGRGFLYMVAAAAMGCSVVGSDTLRNAAICTQDSGLLRLEIPVASEDSSVCLRLTMVGYHGGSWARPDGVRAFDVESFGEYTWYLSDYSMLSDCDEDGEVVSASSQVTSGIVEIEDNSYTRQVLCGNGRITQCTTRYIAVNLGVRADVYVGGEHKSFSFESAEMVFSNADPCSRREGTSVVEPRREEANANEQG